MLTAAKYICHTESASGACSHHDSWEVDERETGKGFRKEKKGDHKKYFRRYEDTNYILLEIFKVMESEGGPCKCQTGKQTT